LLGVDDALASGLVARFAESCRKAQTQAKQR
jgi:hypothetical protein